MNDWKPSGPRGQWGGLNHWRAIRADFCEFAHSLHRQYGDVVTYRVLGQPVYQFASPALAHEVLVEMAKSLYKPDNQKRAFGRIIGNNQFTSDGEQWVARRRLLGPLFLPQAIDRYREIVLRQAADVFNRLSEGEVNVSQTTNTISLLSVAESLFGARIHEQSRKFLEESAIPENAYLPFGLGPRACIGRRFAMMEGLLVLADMVHRFDFRLIKSSAEPRSDREAMRPNSRCILVMGCG